MFSATVMLGNSEYDWNTMPKPRARAGIAARSVSPSISDPPSKGISPAMMRRSVVLPQPDGPSRQTNSCSPTSRLMRSRSYNFV